MESGQREREEREESVGSFALAELISLINDVT